MEESLTLGVAPARAADTDADAFRLLVEQHSRNVFRLALRMTGNEQDAEDVVQETFLKAHRNLSKFEERANFGTWLHRIAVNCALDLMRSRKRHEKNRVAENPEGPSVLDQAPAPGAPPDRLVFSGQLQQRVSAAMKRLSETERAAFVLRHFEGRPIVEIARTLGLRSGAAKNTIFRAVAKLRQELEPLR